MDDPRGGVRHVIPSKGNYKRRAIPPFSRGGEDDPFLRHLRPLFAVAEEVSIVSAFVQESGLRRLGTLVDAALERGASIRLITGDYLNITQVAALENLLDWMEASSAESEETDSAPRGVLDARVIEVARLSGRTRSFHPKSYRFESPGMAVAFVGSSNISLAALETGIEWNLRVEWDADAEAYTQLVDAFEHLWIEARPLDERWVADYAKRARVRQLELPSGDMEWEETENRPDPHELQLEALGITFQFPDHGTDKRGDIIAPDGVELLEVV